MSETVYDWEWAGRGAALGRGAQRFPCGLRRMEEKARRLPGAGALGHPGDPLPPRGPSTYAGRACIRRLAPVGFFPLVLGRALRPHEAHTKKYIGAKRGAERLFGERLDDLER